MGQRVTDNEFDEIYPSREKELSDIHWTPLKVAERSVEVLHLNRNSSVLDVGSGAGKFCIATSAMSGAICHGVELRRRLVSVSTKIAKDHRLSKVRFFHADAFRLDWSKYDAFYFFNPFQEHAIRSGSYRIDGSVPYGKKIFAAKVFQALVYLAGLRPGTQVVTYHGMGGHLPDTYKLFHEETCATGKLCFWRKHR